MPMENSASLWSFFDIFNMNGLDKHKSNPPSEARA